MQHTHVRQAKDEVRSQRRPRNNARQTPLQHAPDRLYAGVDPAFPDAEPVVMQGNRIISSRTGGDRRTQMRLTDRTPARYDNTPEPTIAHIPDAGTGQELAVPVHCATCGLPMTNGWTLNSRREYVHRNRCPKKIAGRIIPPPPT